MNVNTFVYANSSLESCPFKSFTFGMSTYILKVPYGIIEVRISKKIATRIKRMRRNECNDVIKKLTSYSAAEI